MAWSFIGKQPEHMVYMTVTTGSLLCGMCDIAVAPGAMQTKHLSYTLLYDHHRRPCRVPHLAHEQRRLRKLPARA